MRKLDVFFSSAFAFALFFPTRIPTYIIELYTLYIIADLILTKSALGMLTSNLRRFPTELYTLVIFFFINLLSILLSERSDESWHQIEKRLSFLLFPLLVSIRSQQFSNDTIRRTLRFFVLGAFSATILNFFRAVARSFTWMNGELIFNASVEEQRSFFEAILFGGNFFFYEEYSSFMHPTYFGLYILFAVYLLLGFANPPAATMKERISVALMILWFLLNIFLLSSRAVLLSTALLLAIMMIGQIRRRKRQLKYILVLAGSCLLAFIIFFNPRTTDLLQNTATLQSSPRALILKASANVIKENFIFGTGVIDVDYDMREEYKAIGFDEGVAFGYNLHNQYLETLAGSGIIGVLSLLLMISAVARKAVMENNGALLGLMVLLAFNFLFESILNVYSGIVFFCFMSSLLHFYKANRT